MDLAYQEALLALKEDEVPVGAVIEKDNEVVALGHNSREKENSITGHAEINAILEAEKKLGRWSLEGCTLYVTLEPCLMCSGAIIQSRLKRVVFVSPDPKAGAVISLYHVYDEPKSVSHPLISRLDDKWSYQELLSSFFKKKREK